MGESETTEQILEAHIRELGKAIDKVSTQLVSAEQAMVLTAARQHRESLREQLERVRYITGQGTEG